MRSRSRGGSLFGAHRVKGLEDEEGRNRNWRGGPVRGFIESGGHFITTGMYDKWAG